jgi:hypothetical protein
MPVSNPSYFPDIKGNGSIIGITAGRNATGANDFLAGNNAGANSTVNDLIVIGNGSGAGGITGAALAGSIIIGVGSAQLIATDAGGTFPLVLIGEDSLTQFTDGIDSTIIIGSAILNGSSAQDISSSVLIGNNLFTSGSIFPAFTESVVIGTNVNSAVTSADTSIAQHSVLIGSDLFSGTFCAQYDNCVFVGNNIEFPQSAVGVSSNFNIALGSGILVPLAPGNISLGQGGYANTGGANNATSNVCIGDSAFYSGDQNVVLGAGAVNPQIPDDANFGCVIIGASAGKTIIGTSLSNILLIESATTASGGGAVASALIYGSFLTGSLILGDSTVAGANRDLNGTNTVKLLNGTAGSVDPLGGGYFYVLAGALHWVGSSGTDSVVAPA